jgi:hypothetical protein
MRNERHVIRAVGLISLAALALLPGCEPSEGQVPSPITLPTETATHNPDAWVRTFEGPDYGAFFDIALTADGGVLAVGATNHLHVPP